MESHISIKLPTFKKMIKGNKPSSFIESNLESIEVFSSHFKCDENETASLTEERKQQAKLAAEVILQLGNAVIEMAADKAVDLVKATASAVVETYRAKANAFAVVAKAAQPTEPAKVAPENDVGEEIGEDGCFKQPHAK